MEICRRPKRIKARKRTLAHKSERELSTGPSDFYLGQLDEAEQQARQAVELDPLSCYSAKESGTNSFPVPENWMKQMR